MYRNRFNLRKVVVIAICLAGFSIGDVLAQTSTTDPGVVINGVKWATRNVDKPGTFVAKPEESGMFYQWNRRVGWSATDPMINSNGSTAWDTTKVTGATWEKSNDPSPVGWRLPTYVEVQKLLDEDKVESKWIAENGVIGRRFTCKTSGNSIFLPAANSRRSGTLSSVSSIYGDYWGNYWINIRSSYSGWGNILNFNNGNVVNIASMSPTEMELGAESCRSVAE